MGEDIAPPQGEQWEFENALFPAGTQVYIVPEIRQIHPLSPVAGKHGVATTGMYHADLALFGDQLSCVPVIVDGQMWYVEREYVMRSEVSA